MDPQSKLPRIYDFSAVLFAKVHQPFGAVSRVCAKLSSVVNGWINGISGLCWIQCGE
jgi:hypothetical protein